MEMLEIRQKIALGFQKCVDMVFFLTWNKKAIDFGVYFLYYIIN